MPITAKRPYCNYEISDIFPPAVRKIEVIILLIKRNLMVKSIKKGINTLKENWETNLVKPESPEF